MSALLDTVQKFGAGKESYAILSEYNWATCVEVVRVLKWNNDKPTDWKLETTLCTPHPYDRMRYVRAAWNYNKTE